VRILYHLFLRMEFVFGNAGLRQALLIISLANIIVILTSSFLSAIATNLRVKGYGPASNPRRGGVLLSGGIAFLDCMVGQSECRTTEDVHHFQL